MENKLYVGNLSFNVTEQSLADCFAQCGTVNSAKLITDRDTGRSKGFGFVVMSTAEEMQSAIAKYDGQEFEGRALTVNKAKPQENNRAGQGFGNGGRRY